MAAFASPTALAPSLPRLRPGAGNPTSGAFSAARLPGLRPSRPSAVRASLKDAAVAVIATAASAAIAVGNAAAVEVLLGSDDGTLAFVPSQITVKAGEKIVFRNNAGFPHNVVFDEDEVPPGVDVAKISMGEEDLLNAPGETFAVTLTEKGTYTFYCTPHQGAGMAGKVTVN